MFQDEGDLSMSHKTGRGWDCWATNAEQDAEILRMSEMNPMSTDADIHHNIGKFEIKTGLIMN